MSIDQIFFDQSSQLNGLSHVEKIEYLLAQRAVGEKVIAICQQYGVAESTFYYWLSRYSTHDTFDNLSRAPLRTYPKVTSEVRAEVIATHKHNPKLGCWRLSLFDYDGVQLSSVTIWHILTEAKPPLSPSQPLYILTRFHQVWFIDHCHLRTLKNGQKVYSLILVTQFVAQAYYDWIVRFKNASNLCPT